MSASLWTGWSERTPDSTTKRHQITESLGVIFSRSSSRVEDALSSHHTCHQALDGAHLRINTKQYPNHDTEYEYLTQGGHSERDVRDSIAG